MDKFDKKQKRRSRKSVEKEEGEGEDEFSDGEEGVGPGVESSSDDLSEAQVGVKEVN